MGTACRSTALTATIVVAAALALSTVQSPRTPRSRADDTGAADDDATPARPTQPSNVVRLSREGQEQGGIATAEPRRTMFRHTLRGYGVVLAVDKLTGLYNEALLQQTQLRAAEAKAAASRAASGRAQDLQKVFPTAKAQAEAAAATAEADALAVEAARVQLQALRNTAIGQWGPVLGAAVASRSALVDDLVLRKTCLLQLSADAGSLAEAPREIPLKLDNGTATTGHLLSESAQVDQRIQGIGFLYAAPAAPGLLPGRSVLVDLPVGDETAGVDVPSSAVVWQAGKPWLYRRTAPDRFERQAISDASPTPDGGYVVPSGRVPGNEPLVVAGAQVLLSEELRAQIPSDEDDH